MAENKANKSLEMLLNFGIINFYRVFLYGTVNEIVISSGAID